MSQVIQFFIDPLIVPFYYYLLCYLVVWALAAGLARVTADPIVVGSYDRSTAQAWGITLILHLLAGLVFVIWLCMRAIREERPMVELILYLLMYLAIVMLDLYFLLTGRQPKSAQAGAKKAKRRRGGKR